MYFLRECFIQDRFQIAISILVGIRKLAVASRQWKRKSWGNLNYSESSAAFFVPSIPVKHLTPLRTVQLNFTATALL